MGFNSGFKGLNISSDSGSTPFGKVIGCLPNYMVSNSTKQRYLSSLLWETLTPHVRIGGFSKSKILLLRHASCIVLLSQFEGCQDGFKAIFLELISLLSCRFIRQLLDSMGFTKHSACISPLCLRIPESKIQLTVQLTEPHSLASPCHLTPSWNYL